MAQVGRRLARLLAEDHDVGVDEPEGVDDDLALDALDRVDDDGHGAVRQGLEALLRVHVDAGEPAAEPRVGVVPADDHLRPPRLAQHVQHLCLEHRVHGLDAHALHTPSFK